MFIVSCYKAKVTEFILLIMFIVFCCKAVVTELIQISAPFAFAIGIHYTSALHLAIKLYFHEVNKIFHAHRTLRPNLINRIISQDSDLGTKCGCSLQGGRPFQPGGCVQNPGGRRVVGKGKQATAPSFSDAIRDILWIIYQIRTKLCVSELTVSE